MMHAKSDSDQGTMASSSPRSPKPTMYYVQSPSRDSHDEDKSLSMQATPAFNSPMESPSHPSYGRHSRSSSSSRVSGTYGSSSAALTTLGRKAENKKNYKGWRQCNMIKEEGDYGEMCRNDGLSTRCRVLFVVLGFVVIFSVFCLVIWGASRPYKLQISVKSLIVHDLNFGQGSDFTGVPTSLLTTNCSVKMNVYNPATFFGIHVSSVPVNLMYSEIIIATGELKKYYQSRKSHHNVYVNLEGIRVPLYGAGASLKISHNNGGVQMAMILIFDIHSRGNVVGELVKSRHTRHVSCVLSIDSRSKKPIKFNKDSCAYV